jgi:hypothetical protein
MCNNNPPKASELTSSFSNKILIIASFVVQLSTVTVDNFLSTFHSKRHSKRTVERTSFVCGDGT